MTAGTMQSNRPKAGLGMDSHEENVEDPENLPKKQPRPPRRRLGLVYTEGITRDGEPFVGWMPPIRASA